MTQTTTDLIELVLSLSPNERKFFKRSYNSNDEFVLLFDYIQKENYNYSSDGFRQYLIKKQPGVDSKKFTPGYLSVIRSYLFGKILESLRQNYFSNNPTFTVALHTLNAEILIKKGIWHSAMSELEQSKSILDQELSFPYEKTIAMRQELILHYSSAFHLVKHDQLYALYEQAEQIAMDNLQAMQLGKILALARYYSSKRQYDPKQWKPLLKAKVLQNFTVKPDTTNYLIYHNIQYFFALYEKNYQKALEHIQRLEDFWTLHPNMVNRYPKLFLEVCHSYLQLCRIFFQEGSMEAEQCKLLEWLPLLDGSILTREELQMAGELELLYHTCRLHSLGQYEEIVKLSKQKQKLDYKNLILTDSKTLTLFYQALANYITRSYYETTRWTKQLLEHTNSAQTDKPVLEAAAIILHVAALLDWDKTRIKRYEIQKLKDRLAALVEWGSFEISFFDMAFKSIGIRQKFLKEEPRILPKAIESHQDALPEYVVEWLSDTSLRASSH